MRFSVYTLEKPLFEGEIKSATLPAKTGEITILDGHVPLIAELRAGEAKIMKEDGGVATVVIDGGFLEVRPPESGRTTAVVLAEGKVIEEYSGMEAAWAR